MIVDRLDAFDPVGCLIPDGPSPDRLSSAYLTPDVLESRFQKIAVILPELESKERYAPYSGEALSTARNLFGQPNGNAIVIKCEVLFVRASTTARGSQWQIG